MIQRVARHLLTGWLLTACTAALAAEAPGVKIDVIVQGSGIGRGDSLHDVTAETIWIKGDRVRVDFDAGADRRGRILRRGDHAWLLMSSSNRALPANHLKVASITRLDLQRPCWNLGFSCASVEGRVIAGHRAQGWRYRHAGQSGPGGTDSGVFWIDAEHGFLLGYQAQDLTGKSQRMEATDVHFGELPDTTFALPESVRTDIEKADARADRLRGKGH